MKIEWPKNVGFKSVTLPCREDAERGDKLVVTPSSPSYARFVLETHDGSSCARILLDRADIYALADLIKEQPPGLDDE